MNERIKELAEQATVFVADYDGQRWQIDPEKFAELIVKECCAIADRLDRENPHRISRVIKETFRS